MKKLILEKHSFSFSEPTHETAMSDNVGTVEYFLIIFNHLKLQKQEIIGNNFYPPTHTSR